MFWNKKEKTLKEKINDFAVAHYPSLDKEKFIDAKYALYNSTSHFSAVQAVKSGRADKVILCLCWLVNDEGMILAINGKKGKFFDQTWSHARRRGDYRLIREIKQNEYDDIYNILCATKKTFINMFATKKEVKTFSKDSIHDIR